MPESVRLVAPRKIRKNPENPRLIFHQDELVALQESIARQGILVPLSVYADGKGFTLLDGERRWRCALKLGRSQVPVIVQPKPARLQNILMMFAIHNARRDWDPLPTALKLEQLETLILRQQGRRPRERELAELASISVGEVRRLKKLLGLPEQYRKTLMRELEKPRAEQQITVDHVLEVTKASARLRSAGLVAPSDEDRLRQALISKFQTRVLTNTVEPRKLATLARAVARGEVNSSDARQIVHRLIAEPKYGVSQAFKDSVEEVEFQHGIETLAERLAAKLTEAARRGLKPREGLRGALIEVARLVRRIAGP